MTTATTGIGLERLQHLVLWVSGVERSVSGELARRGTPMP